MLLEESDRGVRIIFNKFNRSNMVCTDDDSIYTCNMPDGGKKRKYGGQEGAEEVFQDASGSNLCESRGYL